MSGLLGSPVLEVALGLIFIYFLLSVICSAIMELVAGLLKLRARDLESGLERLLGSTIKDQFLNHPLIKPLALELGEENWFVRRFAPNDPRPGYIPADAFSRALLDILVPAATDTLTVGGIRTAAVRLITDNDPSPDIAARQDLGKAILALVEQSRDPKVAADHFRQAQERLQRLTEIRYTPVAERVAIASSLDELRQVVSALPNNHPARQPALEALDTIHIGLQDVRRSIEAWFDDAMDRVSGVYKRRVHIWLFFIALAVTIALGADTIRMTHTLFTNPTLRAVIVADAEQAVRATATSVAASTGAQAEPRPASTPAPAATVPPVSAPPQSAADQAASSTAGTTTPAATADAPAALDQLDKYAALFGYGDVPAMAEAFGSDGWKWLPWIGGKFIGLLLTTFALTLGAPFWFDLLTKVSNLRAAGKPPAEPDASATTGGSR